MAGLALALIGATGLAGPARAGMDAEGCKGNGCRNISGEWSGQGFRVSDEGARPVRLDVRTGAEGRCQEAKSVEIAPGETVQ
jgi:hypothetical protein